MGLNNLGGPYPFFFFFSTMLYNKLVSLGALLQVGALDGGLNDL